MSTTTIIVIVAVAVVVILILRARAESSATVPLKAYRASQTSTGQPDVRHIADLLLQGRKIEAIKAYMEISGKGLEEAKSAIERYDPILQKFAPAPSPPSFDAVSDWAEIDELLERGNKIAAIKLYRQKTGCDLKEAKDAIDIRDDPS